jgi:hypothetical protein
MLQSKAKLEELVLDSLPLAIGKEEKVAVLIHSWNEIQYGPQYDPFLTPLVEKQNSVVNVVLLAEYDGKVTVITVIYIG